MPALSEPEDLHDGPRQEKIVEISENEKHRCAVLHSKAVISFIAGTTMRAS